MHDIFCFGPAFMLQMTYSDCPRPRASPGASLRTCSQRRRGLARTPDSERRKEPTEENLAGDIVVF